MGGIMEQHNGSTEHSSTSLTAKDKKKIVSTFSRYINAGQVKYLKAGHLDVIETRRSVATFTDPLSGKVMYDCFSSAGCFNVGRRNPVIIKALKEALSRYDLGTSHLVSESKLALARKLTAIAPGDLNSVFFASGGGDAVDCAIKLTRAVTKREKIISTVKAYHGHTGFALSANGKEHYRKYFEPLMPGFSFVPFNDLEAMRQAADKDTAAIIVEPIQGEAGIFTGDTEYLQGLREICDATGAMLIFDEVQTGFGRTGKMFAAEHSGVIPDILALAKSIGGGIFPNGAVLYRPTEAVQSFLKSYPDFHPTYTGGSDIACHVSLKVIEYIEKEDLCARATRNGKKLKDALERLRRENPKIIREVRGIGMMVGIEYIHEFLGPMMSDALAKNGIFAAYSGNAPQVMRFMLPIAAKDEDVNMVIEAIRAAVSDMKTLLPIALPAAKIPGVLKMLNNEKVQTVTFNWIRSIEDFFGKLKRDKRS